MARSESGLRVPEIGVTLRESAYSGSPLMDSFSKVKAMGTSSRFLRFTVSLLRPPINRGPKLTLPTSKNTLGSMTDPTMRKF